MDIPVKSTTLPKGSRIIHKINRVLCGRRNMDRVRAIGGGGPDQTETAETQRERAAPSRPQGTGSLVLSAAKRACHDGTLPKGKVGMSGK